MQHFLKGRHFDSFDEAAEVCQEFFDSKPDECCFDQIRKLANRWYKILENDGLYLRNNFYCFCYNSANKNLNFLQVFTNFWDNLIFIV